MARIEAVPMDELRTRLPARLLPIAAQYAVELRTIVANDEQGGRLVFDDSEDTTDARKTLKVAAALLGLRITFPFRGEEGMVSFYLEKPRARRRRRKVQRVA
jgi:hypothetical protein